MIDKLLKASRRLAKDRDDPEALEELVQAAADYFNPGRSTSLCRACQAPIVWTKTPAGKNAPLDATPITGLDANGESHQIYVSHFATCPAASSFGGARGNGKANGAGG